MTAQFGLDDDPTQFPGLRPMSFTIVAFIHPDEQRSVLYKQKLSADGLLNAVKEAVDRGANLMSIRKVYDAD